MVYPAGIKCAGLSDQAMNFITLTQQKFSQVTPILAGNAGD